MRAEEAGQTGDVRTPVVVVFGTRPEAIKMFPVVLSLARSPIFRPVVVTTGQHEHLVAPILDMAGIIPDVDLGIGRPGLSINGLVADVVSGVDRVLQDGPAAGAAAVLVHGDTSSAMAAATAACLRQVPVAHIEAGLRTNDLMSPFPEEMNRQVIGRLATFHFAPTPGNRENLLLEGIPEHRIAVTGKSGLDALRWTAARRVPFADERLAGLDTKERPIIVVTAHRRENWGAGLAAIAEGVRRVAVANPETLVVWPVHPNPLVVDTLTPVVADVPNVIMTSPMDYAQFAHLLDLAHLAITDSGGIQEEAPALGTPVLVTRDRTERPEGVAAGTLKLVGADADRIVDEATHLLRDPAAHRRMSQTANPFGDGHAADRIVGSLEDAALISGLRPFAGSLTSTIRIEETARA